MSDLSEAEIFDCLITNFRLAAEDCDALAKRPISGVAYVDLRDHLALIDGAMKQAAFWREDERWLDISEKVPVAHRLAGEWLRGVEVESDVPGVIIRKPIGAGELHPCFVKLAEFLRWCAVEAAKLKDAKTNQTGAYLIDRGTAPRRAGHMGWRGTQSGLIVPAGAA